jgi:hypothetical protein
MGPPKVLKQRIKYSEMKRRWYVNNIMILFNLIIMITIGITLSIDGMILQEAITSLIHIMVRLLFKVIMKC